MSDPSEFSDSHDDDVLEADAHINHATSLAYWSNVQPTVNGMLGGFPQISNIDLRGSSAFLAKVRRLIPSLPTSGTLPLGVDCGAGIGRITTGFLSRVCEVVDIVEPVEAFAKVVREGEMKAQGKVGDIYVTGLETWVPSKRYDLIWNQWCVGHLTDEQLVEYLVRCREALTETGLVVLKENINTDYNDMYDPEDSSVTRTEDKFRECFSKAGLAIVKSEEQLGFPQRLGLFPVRFFALRPET